MTIACKVTGEYAQHITCQLDAGQSMFADATKFRWKTTNVTLETRLSTPGGRPRRIRRPLKRVAGELVSSRPRSQPRPKWASAC